jgi:hypothetical protein
MSTVAQQNASRQNGALSSGPVTPEGKARAARNSTKHGLTGGPTVLPNESQKEYDAFKKSYLDTWQPGTLAERDMVEQMVAARWRLARIEQMETAILTAAFEREMEALGDQADKDVAMSKAYADVTENSKGWRSLDRHQSTLQRSYDQALKALMLLQEQTQKQLFEKVQSDIEAINSPTVQNEPGPRTIGTLDIALTAAPTQNYTDDRDRIPDRAAA